MKTRYLKIATIIGFSLFSGFASAQEGGGAAFTLLTKTVELRSIALTTSETFPPFKIRNLFLKLDILFIFSPIKLN